MSWRDARMASISQAGLVEKFVDALVWVFFPVYLYQHGLSLAGIAGWSACTASSGHVAVLYRPSVRQHRPQETIVWGMWLCGTGVALVLLGEGEVCGRSPPP